VTKQPLLTVKNLHKSFGQYHLFSHLHWTIYPGDKVALIGSNGVGKSTFLNILSGLIKADSGSIYFAGHRIDKLSPRKIALLGLRRSFQINHFFKGLSVTENLCLAGPNRINSMLDFTGLQAKANYKASTLSYTEQRMLELAMAVSPPHRLLLLDEPSAGMSKTHTDKCLQYLKQTEQTLILVEHNLDLVYQLCNRVGILENHQLTMYKSVADLKKRVA
jgi:branched-chain amino acid transport system ATP-binding protein